MGDRQFTIGRFSEINDGEMREIEAGGIKVLLARVRGKCYAVGATCTHYGAPLAEGALVGDRIVCPWHHACFDVATGDLLEPPALDALPNYQVEIRDDEILVELPDEPTDRRTPDMTPQDLRADGRVFVIVGGGASGLAAAQTLREDGFAGRVVMVTREDRTPYDRPNLSKDYLQGHAEPEWMPLRPDDFFEQHDIEVLYGKEAASIDIGARLVAFKDGTDIRYDSLLLATGCEPRGLGVPNSNLENIFVLRSFADADAIIAALDGATRAVVIGASFIGMEAAASLAQRGLAVTVAAPDHVPFEKTLGPEIGRMIQRLHENNGVKFRLESRVTGFEGSGTVGAAILDSGERLETDLVIVGIGVTPATGLLEGLELEKDGGVPTDQYLRAAENVYAAGDIASFPDAHTGSRTRIEHWRTALEQGRIAAHNMAGKSVAYEEVPFFWTTQFGVTLLHIGHARNWDEIAYRGEVRAQDFLAFYVRDGDVRAVAAMNRDREMAEFQETMRSGRLEVPSL